MSRYIYQDHTKDGNGAVIPSMTVSVYEAGGTTAANVYIASSGGSAVNSVTSDSTDGSFSLWIDQSDYDYNQKFKITLSKTGFTSQTYDNLVILPLDPPEFETLADDATPSIKGFKNWITGGTTTITDFDDGFTGQQIRIFAEHSLTITDGTNIFLNGSSNFTMTDTDVLVLIQKSDGLWYEMSRGDNGA